MLKEEIVTRKSMPPRQKAVAYVRVSTTEQAESGYSVDAQIQTIKEYCDNEHLELIEVYADRGVSGKSTKGRFQLQQLLTDAKDNKFDVVVVWKNSRMARNLVDLMSFIDTFEKHSIEFRSISERFKIETSTGRMMLQIMASFNEYERDNIAENVKLGMNRRAKEGYTNGGRILGYDNTVDENGRAGLVINHDEAQVVRDIYDLYIQGHGYRSIANLLNQQGLRTKRRNSFSTTAVKDILHNPTYTGLVQYNHYENWEKKRRRGLNTHPIITEGKHEPIVSREAWDKVQALIKLNSRKPEWDNQGQNVLTGLLRCPECGGPMAASNTTNKLRDGTKRRIRYYSCANFRNKGATVCHANSIRADVAENLVAEKLQRVIAHPEIGEKVLQTMQEKWKENSIEIENIIKQRQHEVSEIDKKLSRLQSLFDLEPELAKNAQKRINELTTSKLAINENIKQLRQNKDSKIDFTAKNITWLLKLVATICQGKDKKILKRLYHGFIDQITFDKQKKLVYVRMRFTEDVVKKLSAEAKQTVELPQGGSAVFSCIVEL